MKRKTTMRVLLALAVAAPSVVVPQLVAPAQAQDKAEYPDVPRGHWAYEAINKLSQAGIIEGLPNGTYAGNKPMTRYEFAVAIARILDKMGGTGTTGPTFDPTDINNRLTALENAPKPTPVPTPDLSNYITKQEVNDLIAALRREFADELARLGVRVDALENRVSNLENRVAAPPRVTLTPSLLHRTGIFSPISQVAVPAIPGFLGAPGTLPGATAPGRTVVNGNGIVPVTLPPGNVFLPPVPSLFQPDVKTAYANSKFSYTDFELRLTDRISDRLSVTGALRATGGTQEDPWAADVFGFGSTAYLREGFAVADLSGRSFLGAKGLTAILGRQRTKIGQGLLYDNDLQPTDQLQAQFNVGPIQINGFIGSVNNQTLTINGGGASPYTTAGAVRNIGLTAPGVFGGPGGLFFPNPNGINDAAFSGAAVGFPTPVGADYLDDNEGAIRAGFNLFRISGQPVGIGITRLFDGVQNQQGDSLDLTVPLFNRTIGVEYVRQRNYMNSLGPSGGATQGDPKAYNITVPLFRARLLDLNFAYGKADNDFEYFASSAANPYARTYAEALFDRPMALGAPMINGRLAGQAGQPLYAAAKKAYDFSGTLRLFRRFPLDFRYYRAYGSQLSPGGQKNALDLGSVYTVGSTFNVSPGLDLELKYGRYLVPGPYPSIYYFRVGANVGF